MWKMKSEGEFRTTQTPFEAFAVLTPVFITTDYTDSHKIFYGIGKGKELEGGER